GGYAGWCPALRVAWESFGVTIAASVLGVGLGVAALSWFNMSFIVPHGLLMNIFDWNVLALHTLPIPLLVFLFGMGTVAWQLLRLDPISIIERRDGCSAPRTSPSTTGRAEASPTRSIPCHC